MSLTRREFLKSLGAAAIAGALPPGATMLGSAFRRSFVINFPCYGLEAVPHTFSMMLKSATGPWPGQWVRVAKVFTPVAGTTVVSVDLEDLDDCTWTLMGGGPVDQPHVRQQDDRSASIAHAQLERGALPRPYIRA